VGGLSLILTTLLYFFQAYAHALNKLLCLSLAYSNNQKNKQKKNKKPKKKPTPNIQSEPGIAQAVG
jgi:hypothetical protein